MQEENRTSLADEELMSLYQAGDFASFEILYSRHSGRVFAYLKTKVSSEVAQELVQEIFEKLHRARQKYDTQYPFLSWIFTIARNALFDFLKQSETKVLKAADSSPLLLESIAASAPSAHSSRDISSVMAVLPPHQRRAIELRYLHEWSFEKIAGEMKTSEDNIRQLISRGIKKARHAVGGKGGVQ